MGFTTVALGGAVFKACCLADPTLLSQVEWQSDLGDGQLPGSTTASAATTASCGQRRARTVNGAER